MIPALLIFLATYAVVAVGRLPGLRLDRAGAAIIGASLMVGVGALSLEEAYRAVDLNTLVLLLGMMILVANLKLAGFFALAADATARAARGPLGLLAGVVAVAGVLSAFLVNDTVCLMLTPLVAELARTLRRNPVPYLLAVAMSSNIGSTATITGNPQNIMIGSFSGIPYARFAAALTPVAAIGLAIVFVLIVLAFRREFLAGARFAPPALAVRIHRALLLKSLAATAAMVAFFFAGVAPAKVAIIGGALLLLTRRLKPERVYREIDWALLLLFAGLFVVVAGVEKALLTPETLALADRLALDRPAVLAPVTALLSNLVSNVPTVLVLKPFVAVLAHPERAWLVLAMASTLAGNLTIVGSVANLIVVERARQSRIEIGFWTYLKVGVPVTLLTIAVGVWWLGG
ncbi:MAG TPA: anion transporter [Stellaceae bacterium]|nr:anion transporter [Stellaceae bacterium]